MGVERESLQDESARERFLGANLSESLHYYAVHSNWQRERELRSGQLRSSGVIALNGANATRSRVQ